ncbi:hypothetical protein [Aquiflexum gelatinilyticum]|uniref:Seryl-tRNA synthetase n=1 Tax=Aquiflexum gelatinilyticum TaxID=2961943 RepID=A0A9X2T0Q6_9BACT|nr:hypothetical protein [Aquiflexum gelatinilyticum]MCR9015858.1 hypothetical protein [Aquiflexum gelatinilyticum]
MKRFNLILMLAIAFTFFSSALVLAGGKDKVETKPKMPEAEMKILVDRLEEIKTMDRSMMDRTEKKELRSEVREINEEIKRDGGGVYLSIGALLLVIILLILLL